MNPHRKIGFLNNFFDIFDRYPREYFIVAFFALFFLAIIKETFSYTVLNYDFYKNLADKQQVGEVEIPVARGTIYSSTGSGTVLSTSVDLNDLAIDPQIQGDIQKLQQYLTDIVYKELCYIKTSEECYQNMLKYLRKLQIIGFSSSESYVKDLLGEYIGARISQKKVTTVLLVEELENEKQSTLFAKNIPGVYINNSNLYVNPEEIVSSDAAALQIQEVIGGDIEVIKNSIRQRDLRYVPIINKISLSTSDEVKQMIEEEYQALRQGIISQEESIGGFIILTPRPQRIYPEGDVAAQVIGFIDAQGEGHYGIEGKFHDLLQGSNGQMISRKDIQGRIIDPISLNRETLTGQGVDVYSTIDRNIQRKVERILQEGVEKYRANKGTVVVMNPKTGAVLAMANYPTFDPNSPGDVYELEKVNSVEYPNPEIDLLGKVVFIEDNQRGDKYFYDGKEIYLRTAEREEYGDSSLTKYKYKNDFGAGVYKNDAISSLYEPGSIMKAITVAVGIDADEINTTELYNDVGKVTIDNFTIKNESDKCLGYHTFGHALDYSCNVGMIRIVQRVGVTIFHQYLHDFGFGEITDISLQGEVNSPITPYEKWSKAQLFTSSYGLGVSVTPLQMAAAYSVIANGGIYIKPRIIESIQYSDGKKIVYHPEEVRRVIKETTAKQVLKMLIDGVEKGVAGNGGVEGYSVAGKTGTSQIAFRGKYETGAASTNASFAGFGPAEDPLFVIVVKLERPRTSNYGGATASFIFADIAKELFEYFDIPKKVLN